MSSRLVRWLLKNIGLKPLSQVMCLSNLWRWCEFSVFYDVYHQLSKVESQVWLLKELYCRVLSTTSAIQQLDWMIKVCPNGPVFMVKVQSPFGPLWADTPIKLENVDGSQGGHCNATEWTFRSLLTFAKFLILQQLPKSFLNRF